MVATMGAMKGFGLPRLRWLVLGAAAAGGWAMMQDTPGNQRFRPAEPVRKPVASAPAPRPLPRAEQTPATPVPPASIPGRATQQAVALPQPRPPAEAKHTASRPAAPPERRPAAEIAKRPELAKAANQPPAAKPEQKVAALSSRSFPPPPTPSTRVKDVVYARTTVSLRQRADAASSVLAQLKQGDAATVFARSGKWLLVSTRNGRGWVHSDNLQPPDPRAPRPSRDLIAAPKPGAAG